VPYNPQAWDESAGCPAFGEQIAARFWSGQIAVVLRTIGTDRCKEIYQWANRRLAWVILLFMVVLLSRENLRF
jgi:hypothetical protein